MLQGLELSEKMHVVMIGILPLFHCILIPFCSIYSSFGWLFLYSYFHFYFLLVLPELCGHLRGIQHQGGPPGPPMNFSGPLHPHGLPLGPLPTFANQPFQGQNVPPTGCQLGPMGPMGPTCLGPINSPGQLGPNQGIQQGHIGNSFNGPQAPLLAYGPHQGCQPGPSTLGPPSQYGANHKLTLPLRRPNGVDHSKIKDKELHGILLWDNPKLYHYSSHLHNKYHNELNQHHPIFWTPLCGQPHAPPFPPIQPNPATTNPSHLFQAVPQQDSTSFPSSGNPQGRTSSTRSSSTTSTSSTNCHTTESTHRFYDLSF